MEKRKYVDPERYDETPKLYRELAAECAAAGNTERADRCTKIARAEYIRGQLARIERHLNTDGEHRPIALAGELSELERIGKVEK